MLFVLGGLALHQRVDEVGLVLRNPDSMLYSKRACQKANRRRVA